MRLLSVTAILMTLLVCACSTPKHKTLLHETLLSRLHNGFYQVPVGLCEDYPEETTTMDVIRSDFEFLQKNNIKFLRISFGWDAIEHERDQYDWLFWDDFVKMAVEEYGITLIPYVCYTPNWNSTAKDEMDRFWNHTPVDYEEFGEFMFDLVTRYKKWIGSWELWNEPDISAYWSGTSGDLARLTKIGAEAVKRADPEAIVVLAGLAHKVEFTRELFRDHGISPYVDVVNMHNYFETWHPHHLEAITDYVNDIYQIVREYGDEQVLWMAEVGYSTWRMGGAKVSDSYSAYYDYEHTPEYQAVDLFKRCALVASTGQISAIAWYELKDLPMEELVIGDNNNRNLGIAYTDHSQKPATDALVFFNKLFGNPYRPVKDGIDVQKNPDSDSHVLVFEMMDGSAVVVGWLQTCNYEKRGDDSSGMVKDEREETISVQLPLDLKGPAQLFNELGEGARYEDVTVNEGHTLASNITLKGGSITIIHLQK